VRQNLTTETYDVIIAGGGPAGSSAAIHLAHSGVRVLLVEQKQFPRPKLCGEFISPECFQHFEKLGVADGMLACNPASLNQTVFYSRRGHRISVPSAWLGTGAALGLSRAEMDNNLLRRAREAGADVLEDTTVADVIEDGDRVCGVRIRTSNAEFEYRSNITIDATGRGRVLSRKAESKRRPRASLVAFKAHFSGTDVAEGACEIYSYTRGYGGVSTIEGGLSNLCFIVSASDVRRLHSDPDAIMRETVMSNRRAAQVLASATRCSDWLSVSLESFGMQLPSAKPGLLAIGDSAAFIDPFTGSGMLMALQSGELAAKLILQHNTRTDSASLLELSRAYNEEYRKTFYGRLRTCRWLRRTAYTPLLADLTITLFSVSDRFRNRVARATRSSHSPSEVRVLSRVP